MADLSWQDFKDYVGSTLRRGARDSTNKGTWWEGSVLTNPDSRDPAKWQKYASEVAPRYADDAAGFAGGIKVLKAPFPKNYANLVRETHRGFSEQAYPHTATVRVTWPDGATHIDQVKGMNEGHALARAASNWSDASMIEAVEEALMNGLK